MITKQRTVRELVYRLRDRKPFPFAPATVTVLCCYAYFTGNCTKQFTSMIWNSSVSILNLKQNLNPLCAMKCVWRSFEHFYVFLYPLALVMQIRLITAVGNICNTSCNVSNQKPTVSKAVCHICYLHDRCRRVDCSSTWACQKTRPVSSTAPLSRVNPGARVSEGARLGLLCQPPPSSNWKQTTIKSVTVVILSSVCRPAITSCIQTHIYISVQVDW